MLKKLFYLFLLFTTPAVLADIFPPSQYDYSISILGNLFGSSIGSESLGGVAQPVFAQVIQQFNWIIVTAGVIVAGYISIVSVANTSQEGSVMGEKWSAVWVPIRSVAGLALMTPSPTSGYSAIQAFVMWVVVNGVGAADALWKIVLDGIQDGAATAMNTNYSTSVDPNIANQINDPKFTQNILLANVCMKALSNLASLPQPTSNGPEKTLYESIHGTPNAPSTTYDDLFKYGNALSSYITNQSQPIPDNPANPQKYTLSANLNFGAQNASKDDWKNICGTMTISVYITTDDYNDKTNIPTLGPQQIQDLNRIFNITVSSIQAMNELFSSLATTIVNGTIQPRTKTSDASNNQSYSLLEILDKNSSSQLAPSGYISLAQQAYVQNMMTGTVPLAKGGWVQNSIDQGLMQGWMSAGSFYFLLSRNNGNQKLFTSLKQTSSPGTFVQSSTAPSAYQPPHCDSSGSSTGCVEQVYSSDNTDTNVETNNPNGSGTTKVGTLLNSGSLAEGYISMFLAQATVYYNTDKPLSTSDKINPAITSPEQLSASVSGLVKLPDGGNTNIINTLVSEVGTGDVIVGLSQYGYSLMATSEAALSAIYGVLITAAFAVGLSETEINTVIFGSFEFKGFSEMWGVMVPLILSLVLPVFSALWTFGATLNIYLPIIPYMIFTVSALGWGILVIEAIIAAPILALSLVTPGGDELGKAEEGLGILASIALRPALMILGFLLAGKIYQAIVTVVNTGMADTYKLIGAGGSTGNGQGTMFSWIAALATYVTFVVSLANKCFGFIYLLPDQIMRWIGHNRENSGGANQELGDAKQAQEKANTGFNAATSGAAQLGGKIADSAAKKSDIIREKEKEQQREDRSKHEGKMSNVMQQMNDLKTQQGGDPNTPLKPSDIKKANDKAKAEAKAKALADSNPESDGTNADPAKPKPITMKDVHGQINDNVDDKGVPLTPSQVKAKALAASKSGSGSSNPAEPTNDDSEEQTHNDDDVEAELERQRTTGGAGNNSTGS